MLNKTWMMIAVTLVLAGWTPWPESVQLPAQTLKFGVFTARFDPAGTFS